MWHFMDILHFCPFVVEDKKQKGPNSTGEIRLTLCRAVQCIWLISLCSCMWLRMDSDFPEGVKRIHNKTTAILRWSMFNPYCCLQTVWGIIVVKREGGKELYLAVFLPNVLNISYYWHFKAGSLSRGTNAALLSCCPAQNDCTGNHSWEILEKPSKHLWLERISLKKNRSVVLRNACRQLGALKMCHTLHDAISTVRRATVH